MPLPRPRSTTSLPTIAACCLTLIVAGLVSVAFGQDANWDLLNYHLYNPWAFLGGRLGTDLGTAGISTYVNPLIDLPYYLLIDRLEPRTLAFSMGVVQGTSALLLYRLARRLLPAGQGRLVAGFLALTGCLGSVFLSEFGSTMGDDATAAILLGALVLLLEPVPRTGAARLVIVGLVAGIGTGLKLTNATFALGLLAAVALTDGSWRQRFARSTGYVAGAALGFALSYGYWFVTMWRHFGNPFYPQFNRFFGSPLAAATIVSDNKWSPTSWVEALLFPISFNVFPLRVNEVPLVEPMWLVVYPLLFAWIAGRLLRRLRHAAANDDGARDRAIDRLFVFAAVGYLAWMVVFSIGRYLVLVDLLLPLLAWLLLQRLVPARLAALVGVAAPTLATLFTVLYGFATWGHADFADVDGDAYRVEVPRIADPAHATVLVLTAPIAWIFTRFPPELAYLALNIRFPDSPGYRARVEETIARRGGPVYAVLPPDKDLMIAVDSRLNRRLAGWGIGHDTLACRYVAAIFAHQPDGDVVFDDSPDARAANACRFRRDGAATPMFDRDARAIAAGVASRGFAIDVDRCSVHRAFVGQLRYEYRFCPVTRKPAD